jgi:hypothetical protein
MQYLHCKHSTYILDILDMQTAHQCGAHYTTANIEAFAPAVLIPGQAIYKPLGTETLVVAAQGPRIFFKTRKKGTRAEQGAGIVV